MEEASPGSGGIRDDEDEELVSPTGQEEGGQGLGGSGRRKRKAAKGEMIPDSTDRKKQTHLRCERQRREAINVSFF